MKLRARGIAVLAVALVGLFGCRHDQGKERGPAAGSSVRTTSTSSAKPAVSANAVNAPLPQLPPGNPAHGKEIVEKFECNRCHEVPESKAVALDKHCVQCHDDIVKGTFKAPADMNHKWAKTLVRYRDVPSLVGLGERLDPEWVEAFLQEPRNLRPNMVSTMPRLALSREQAHDIAAYLASAPHAAVVPGSTAAADGAALAQGRSLIESRGCGTCHTFSGVPALPVTPKIEDPAGEAARAIALAPDLRFVRQRFRKDRLVAWLMNPSALKPGTRMPPTGLTEPEARALAGYILETPLAERPVAAVPARLPVLARAVTFDEVNDKVLMKTCRHCHAEPDIAMGDGGPGNTGGFGFKPRQLNLTSYEYSQAGLLDDHGERKSLFAPNADGTPLLVAAILARQQEQVTETTMPGVRGMPLGLPALSAEEIQLVESWVAQGRPR